MKEATRSVKYPGQVGSDTFIMATMAGPAEG
jgi:hypothetical protein